MPEEPSASSPETPPPHAPRKSVGTGFAGETTGTPNIPPDDATVRMESSSTMQVIGDFEILGKLGQGGMGTVYRARQISLDRQVALKILPATLEADAEFVSRFQREARVAASLSHGNLVKVYAAGEVDGCHFIAMELIEGETLGQWLKRGPLPPPEALRICGDVARALEHGWNRAQLIHRDIKPGNIFLSTNGAVKVGDLGLAKTMGGDTTGLTQTGTAMGTPHYISPEQARGESDLDFRADIYSLGCTLYQMLTGRTPYIGSDPVAVFHQHIHGAPPAILKVLPGCPIPLARLVGKMLKKVKRERHASYAELLAEIERAEAIFNPAASALESTLPADPDGTLIATPGNTPATPRSATPVTAPLAPPAAKSKVPLYGGIAAGLAVLIGIIVAVLPKEEKLTAAERYAREHPSTPAPAEPTPAASTPAPARPASSAPWRDWVVERRALGKFVNNPTRVDDGTQIRATTRGENSWEDTLCRDGAVRATWTVPAGNEAQLSFRRSKTPEGLVRMYQVALGKGGFKLQTFETTNGGTYHLIKQWPVPAGFDPVKEFTLEARFVDQRITVLVDGKELGTVEDATISEPGPVAINLPTDALVWKFEFQNLDAPTAPIGAQTPAASAGWQPLVSPTNWRQDRDKHEFRDGLLHFSRGGLPVSQPWADGAIRALIVIREGSQGPAVVARADETNGLGSHYRFGVGSDGRHLFLGLFAVESANQVILARHFLPRPVAPGDRLALELRVQGDRLTGLLDGVVVAEARDTRITRAGRWGLTAADGWFESAEVQPLPASAPAKAPAEAWQDLLHGSMKPGLSRGAEQTPEGFRLPEDGAAVRTYSGVSSGKADVAIRLRTTMVSDSNPTLMVRESPVGVYLLFVRGGRTVELRRTDAASGSPTDLRVFPLPTPLQPGQDYMLELRAVGSTLTVSLNGEVLGSSTDDVLKKGGTGVVASIRGGPVLVQSLEVLDLDAK